MLFKRELGVDLREPVHCLQVRGLLVIGGRDSLLHRYLLTIRELRQPELYKWILLGQVAFGYEGLLEDSVQVTLPHDHPSRFATWPQWMRLRDYSLAVLGDVVAGVVQVGLVFVFDLLEGGREVRRVLLDSVGQIGSIPEHDRIRIGYVVVLSVYLDVELVDARCVVQAVSLDHGRGPECPQGLDLLRALFVASSERRAWLLVVSKAHFEPKHVIDLLLLLLAVHGGHVRVGPVDGMCLSLIVIFLHHQVLYDERVLCYQRILQLELCFASGYCLVDDIVHVKLGLLFQALGELGEDPGSVNVRRSVQHRYEDA